MREFLRSECGASAAEYAVLLAVLGGALAVASLSLGQSISDSMQTAAGLITGPHALGGGGGHGQGGGNGNGNGDTNGNGGGNGHGRGGGNGNGTGRT